MTAPLMTPVEVAAFLAVPLSTVYDWSSARRIPAVKIGRTLRFVRADVEAWITAQRREALELDKRVTVKAGHR